MPTAYHSSNVEWVRPIGSLTSDGVRELQKLKAENVKLRELCETFGMIANDAVCDYYERDEMLEQANADARELGIGGT